jgi:hypothetical protein
VLDVEDKEIVRTKKLIEAVYKKIVTLDFPDVSKYAPTYKGLVQFEDDLIEGTTQLKKDTKGLFVVS